MGRPRTPLDVRFWAKVKIVDDEDSCWPWIGEIDGNGYGRIRLGGYSKKAKAHRVAFKIQNGYIDEDLDVLHSCDNRPCCRDKHLFQGTHLQNMKDMIKKGRNRKLRGSELSQTKLTKEQVLEIRKKYKPYIVTIKKLSEEYNISKGAIQGILSGVNWKHI